MADYASYTLTQLQTLMALRWEGTPFWTPEEATYAINEGLRLWNAMTGTWREELELETLMNDPWHPLEGSMTYRTRVSVNGIPLKPTSMFSLDKHRPNWETETTASGGDVPTEVKYWMPAGLQLIALWPADAVGQSELLVDGVTATPVLVNAGDFINISDSELNTLLGYALHYVTFKAGGSWFQNSLPLYKAFLAAAAEKNAQLKASIPYRGMAGLDLGREQEPIEV